MDVPNELFDGRPTEDAELERCPDCGGLVFLPCLYCRTARTRRGDIADPTPTDASEYEAASRHFNRVVEG